MWCVVHVFDVGVSRVCHCMLLCFQCMYASLQLTHILHKFVRAMNSFGVYIAYVVIVQPCSLVCQLSLFRLHDYKLGALACLHAETAIANQYY